MALQLEGGSEAKKYNVACTVLAGVILLIILPFGFASLIYNRQRKDPSRQFIPWLKAAFVFFIITLGLLLAQGILITYELYTTAAHWHITRASFHVGYLYEFFRTVLAATVTVFLLQLSPGIHQALVGATNTVDKIVKVFAYVMGFIVTALALAYYGLLADFQEEYTNNLGSIHQISEAYERAWTVNRLMGATAIILWVESLLITILSVYTFIHRRASQMKSSSALYLCASLFSLLSSTWNFTYAVHWLLRRQRVQDEEIQENYVPILNIVLGHWSQGAILIITFFIALKNRNADGVWSAQKTSYGSMA